MALIDFFFYDKSEWIPFVVFLFQKTANILFIQNTPFPVEPTNFFRFHFSEGAFQ